MSLIQGPVTPVTARNADDHFPLWNKLPESLGFGVARLCNTCGLEHRDQGHTHTASILHYSHRLDFLSLPHLAAFSHQHH